MVAGLKVEAFQVQNFQGEGTASSMFLTQKSHRISYLPHFICWSNHRASPDSRGGEISPTFWHEMWHGYTGKGCIIGCFISQGSPGNRYIYNLRERERERISSWDCGVQNMLSRLAGWRPRRNCSGAWMQSPGWIAPCLEKISLFLLRPSID